MVIYPHCSHPCRRKILFDFCSFYKQKLFVFFCSLNCFYVVFEHEINVKGGTNSLTYWFSFQLVMKN